MDLVQFGDPEGSFTEFLRRETAKDQADRLSDFGIDPDRHFALASDQTEHGVQFDRGSPMNTFCRKGRKH